MARDLLLTLAKFLTPEALADLTAARAESGPLRTVDRGELEELLARHGLEAHDALLEIDHVLAGFRVGSVLAGVVETVTHLAKQVTGEAYLAHVAHLV